MGRGKKAATKTASTRLSPHFPKPNFVAKKQLRHPSSGLTESVVWIQDEPPKDRHLALRTRLSTPLHPESQQNKEI